jgi:hypothetical protein
MTDPCGKRPPFPASTNSSAHRKQGTYFFLPPAFLLLAVLFFAAGFFFLDLADCSDAFAFLSWASSFLILPFVVVKSLVAFVSVFFASRNLN